MSELSSINCTRRLILTCIRNRSPLLIGLILTNFALFHFIYPTRAANETTGNLPMSKEVDILDVYGGTSKIDMDEMEERYLVIQRHIDDKLQVQNLTYYRPLGPSFQCIHPDEPIDAVFIWFNQTTEFMRSVVKVKYRTKPPTTEQLKSDFPFDFDKLKFMIRSIEQHASWIRKIWIVTNGDKPAWLSTDDPHIAIVDQASILFWGDVPTFNRNAIENSLHKINGISDHFLYFNENTILKTTVCPDDFFNDEDGYVFHATGLQSISDDAQCPIECYSDAFGDDRCDQECNRLECLWDGLDCDWMNSLVSEATNDTVFDSRRAQDFVGHVFEKELIAGVDRYTIANVPFLINKNIMAELQKRLYHYYRVTLGHKTPRNTDLLMPFTYVNWVLQAPLANENINGALYQSNIYGPRHHYKLRLTNDTAANRQAIGAMNAYDFETIKFLTIDTSHQTNDTVELYVELGLLLEALYPGRSRFEI